jgi:hypothetical protein
MGRKKPNANAGTLAAADTEQDMVRLRNSTQPEMDEEQIAIPGKPRRRSSGRITVLLDPHLREQLRRMAIAMGRTDKEIAAEWLSERIELAVRKNGGDFAACKRVRRPRVDFAALAERFRACKEPFLPLSEAVVQLDIKAATLRSCIRAGCPTKTFGNGKARIYLIPADVAAWASAQ